MENNSDLKSKFAILFVDDEEKLRKYFAMSVKKNFEVFCAQNVEEAKEILQEHHEKIGVVLTDQRMPGGNGVVLLKYLKERYPRIIRLLTTAYSDLSDAIDAINKGEIIRYIQKPWDFSLLATELSSAMELFELRVQCDELMAEKLVIKRKTQKLNKIKLLVSLVGAFGTLKNAQRSVAGYIRNFVIGDNFIDDIDENFIRSSDMGSKDIEEVKFLSDMASNVFYNINNSQDISEFGNYSFRELQDLISTIRSGSNIEFNGSWSNNIEINLSSIRVAFEALFSFMGDKVKLIFEENSVIRAEFVDVEFQNNLLDNNLLLFALFIGHSGFVIDDLNQNSFCLNYIGNSDFDDEHLDDLILSAMLA